MPLGGCDEALACGGGLYSVTAGALVPGAGLDGCGWLPSDMRPWVSSLNSPEGTPGALAQACEPRTTEQQQFHGQDDQQLGIAETEYERGHDSSFQNHGCFGVSLCRGCQSLQRRCDRCASRAGKAFWNLDLTSPARQLVSPRGQHVELAEQVAAWRWSSDLRYPAAGPTPSVNRSH